MQQFLFIMLTFVYSSKSFESFPAHHQELQWQPLVLPSYRGDSHAAFVVGPTGRPDHEHSTTATTIRSARNM
jgi:hypothetical protein